MHMHRHKHKHKHKGEEPLSSAWVSLEPAGFERTGKGVGGSREGRPRNNPGTVSIKTTKRGKTRQDEARRGKTRPPNRIN